MRQAREFSHVPIIDVSDLVAGTSGRWAGASQLGQACRESGFFYVVRHGVDEGLQTRLRDLSREFFAQDLDTKLRIRISLGGRAWRGYFRVQPIDLPAMDVPPDDQAERWDHASVHAFEGTYGDYLLNKVGKVFPELRQEVARCRDRPQTNGKGSTR